MSFLEGTESNRESLPLMLLINGSCGSGSILERGVMVVICWPNRNLDGGGNKVATGNKRNLDMGWESLCLQGETSHHCGGGELSNSI